MGERNKYRLEQEGSRYRLIACRPILLQTGRTVKTGAKGGLVDGFGNLSQDGRCWIANGAVVTGNAKVSGDALVTHNAIVCGDARVEGNSIVGDDCQVSGNAVVKGNAVLKGRVWVCGDSVLGLPGSPGDMYSASGKKIADFEAEYKNGELSISRYIPEHAINPRRLVVRVNAAKAEDVSGTMRAMEYAVIGRLVNRRNQGT